jgi:hypothetical protein
VFGAFLFPHVYAARRGPLFPAVMILLFTPTMSKKSVPKRALILGGLFALGFTLLLFVEVRGQIYGTGTWGDALDEIVVSEVMAKKAIKVSDNEFLYNCYFISTVYENGKYQYGTGHLGLLLHWVPRFIWPEKPVLGEGWYSFEELYSDIENHSKLPVFGTGCSAGGFAESIIQYGFAAPIFWFILSFFLARRFAVFKIDNSPLPLCDYLSTICVSHWLLGQGFAACFVPWCAFVVVPKLVFFASRR